ncbi:hypothetical protein ABZ639_28435 [Saccharomonospora sp. NPDC006951]
MTETTRAGAGEPGDAAVLLRRAAIAVLRAADEFAESGERARAARLDLIAARLLREDPDDRDDWQRVPAVMCGSEDPMP